jgi:hypothetical protein
MKVHVNKKTPSGDLGSQTKFESSVVGENWRLIQLMATLESPSQAFFNSGFTTTPAKGEFTSTERKYKNEVSYKNFYLTNPLISYVEEVKQASRSRADKLVEESSLLRVNEALFRLNSKVNLSTTERFPINANFVAQWLSENIVSSKTYKLSLLCDRVIKAAKLVTQSEGRGNTNKQGSSVVSSLNRASVERAQLVGIKIIISGRILGAEIATSKRFTAGQIPNNTIKISKQSGFALAKTRSGTIGIKVTYFWKS